MGKCMIQRQITLRGERRLTCRRQSRLGKSTIFLIYSILRNIDHTVTFTGSHAS